MVHTPDTSNTTANAIDAAILLTGEQYDTRICVLIEKQLEILNQRYSNLPDPLLALFRHLSESLPSIDIPVEIDAPPIELVAWRRFLNLVNIVNTIGTCTYSITVDDQGHIREVVSTPKDYCTSYPPESLYTDLISLGGIYDIFDAQLSLLDQKAKEQQEDKLIYNT